MFWDQLTIPVAFRAAKQAAHQPGQSVERLTRRKVGIALAKGQVIPAMIEKIKALFGDPKGVK